MPPSLAFALTPLIRRRSPTMIHPLTPTTSLPRVARALTYLTATQSAALDDTLMSPRYAYTLAQLMELAGQAVAHAVADVLHTGAHVCIAAGPGNNGGDGIVAARHLREMNYNVSLCAPRTNFDALLRQARAYGVEMSNRLPKADLVVDSVFGFSFRGDAGVREPFATLLHDIDQVARDSLLVAVDVPSGWHVERGRVFDTAIRTPDVLVSLSAPKQFAKEMPERASGGNVVHYVGGRFVPPDLAEEMGIVLPEFVGVDTIARVA